MSNKFNFTINDFNGPLDLLLHLVKESKMDIYEVPIENIMNQYIQIIEEMEKLNIDIASEYLVVASELIHLKSKMLLNIKEKEDEEEEGFGLVSEEALRKRLLEYKTYKQITEDFKNLEAKRSEVYTKVPESLIEYKKEVELSSDTTLDDLLEAFNNFLDRQKYMKPLSTKITRKEITVEKRTHEIRSMIKTRRKLDFLELFDDLTREYLVVTFLSVLEMTKNKEINIIQDSNFSNIIIEAK